MTDEDKELLLEAAELIASGKQEYSCVAIKSVCKDDTGDWFDCQLRSDYGEFYQKPHLLNWYIGDDGEIAARSRRVLMLLLFREVGLEGVRGPEMELDSFIESVQVTPLSNPVETFERRKANDHPYCSALVVHPDRHGRGSRYVRSCSLDCEVAMTDTQFLAEVKEAIGGEFSGEYILARVPRLLTMVESRDKEVAQLQIRIRYPKLRSEVFRLRKQVAAALKELSLQCYCDRETPNRLCNFCRKIAEIDRLEQEGA